ncbi:hypothetical protein [Micromonospora sp. NPDC047730]|uniref:hypothetical protein n=1 Tax=Micromonospora sp. NPDC047730 TaxID=3364253 RepID=UPI003723DE87
MAAKEQFKTFVKDGKERVAYSPSDVVALRFDGWTEKVTPRQPPSSSATRTSGGTSAAKADTDASK